MLQRITFSGFLAIGKTENYKLCTYRRQTACGGMQHMCMRMRMERVLCLIDAVAAGQSDERSVGEAVVESMC